MVMEMVETNRAALDEEAAVVGGAELAEGGELQPARTSTRPARNMTIGGARTPMKAINPRGRGADAKRHRPTPALLRSRQPVPTRDVVRHEREESRCLPRWGTS